LINQAIEVLFQLAGDFAGSPGPRTISQALGALLGKALSPGAEGRIGKVAQRGDGIDVVAGNDFPDGLRAAKDARFLRLLEHGISRRQRISAKVTFEGTHRLAPKLIPSYYLDRV
jgi:hypothetical protein